MVFLCLVKSHAQSEAAGLALQHVDRLESDIPYMSRGEEFAATAERREGQSETIQYTRFTILNTFVLRAREMYKSAWQRRGTKHERLHMLRSEHRCSTVDRHYAQPSQLAQKQANSQIAIESNVKDALDGENCGQRCAFFRHNSKLQLYDLQADIGHVEFKSIEYPNVSSFYVLNFR